MLLPNIVEACGLSPSKQVQEAVSNMEQYLTRINLPPLILRKRQAHGRQGMKLTLMTRELKFEEAWHYQSQIGVVRWCVKLGRIDIIAEISILASHNALPIEGHRDAVFLYLLI